MKKLLWLLCFALSGCSTFTASKHADGTVSVFSARLFTDAEIGEVTGETANEKISIKGVKTTAKADALDLLKSAASIARP